MVLKPTKTFQECQRIQVMKQTEGANTTVKISLERFSECLGWYAAGALSIPLHQLPLLQQALDELKIPDCVECKEAILPVKKIIPFPTMMPEFAAPVDEVVG
jgi:hypothetical protein